MNRNTIAVAGNIYFGGTHGVTSFNPRELSQHVKATLLFQNLMVHNKPVRPGEGIIDKDLSLSPDVHLDNESNSFGTSLGRVMCVLWGTRILR